jgi:hypothetical protein
MCLFQAWPIKPSCRIFCTLLSFSWLDIEH